LEYVDVIFNAVECIRTLLLLCVFHSVVSCVVISVLYDWLCYIYMVGSVSVGESVTLRESDLGSDDSKSFDQLTYPLFVTCHYHGSA
jgi:hypothetical protein